MKEVQEKRLAGPYETVPFTNFIQSPIGLVPKAGGKTRLIFHLSFDFPEKEDQQGGRSVNYHTPKKDCSVHYNDLDSAVRSCLLTSSQEGTKSVFMAKSDLMSAFRMLPIKPEHYCWLLMKCKNPENGQVMFFVGQMLTLWG